MVVELRSVGDSPRMVVELRSVLGGELQDRQTFKSLALVFIYLLV